MRKVLFISILVFFSACLQAQYGCLAVFEKGADDKIKIVRIFSVKCTVTKMDDDSHTRIKESVNEYMHLDGKVVYTAFYIPWGDFELGKKFTLDEYVPKKEAKLVKFIRESEEILLDQSGNVVASKVKAKPLGSLIVYFNNGTENYQWAICEVWGKSLSKSPGDIAKQCGGEGARGGVKIYEWKPGLDWNAAEKVARKNSSQYALRGYYNWIAMDDWGIEQAKLNQTGGFVKEIEEINQGKRPDGEKIDYSKEDYIDNLPPAAINKLKSYFKDEQDKLLQDGWVRFYSKYDYLPYRGDLFSINRRTDRACTVILVAEDSTAEGHVSEAYNDLSTVLLGPGKKLIYYDIQSPDGARQTSAFIHSLATNKVPFGIIVYKKEPNFSADLQAILNDSKLGFSSYKAGVVRSENGNNIFMAKKSLGHLNAEISYNNLVNKWEYTVYTRHGDKDADFIDKQLNKFLDEKEKQGIYIVRRRESADKTIFFTDVFDKLGNLILATEKQKNLNKKLKWIFYEQSK